jgi:type I restriction enzyme S subunit
LKDTLLGLSGKTTIDFIAISKLKNLLIPIPPLQEQKRIVSVLYKCFTAIDKSKSNTEQNLKNEKELFKSYLQGVFLKKGKDWEVRKLGECFKLKSGDMLSAKMMKFGKIPVYGGNGISGFHDTFNLQGENVIVGRVGALCGNVRSVNEKIWLTDNAFLLTDYKFDFDKFFLTYLLNFKNLRNYARQTAQPVISNSSLNNVELSFPKSKTVQQSIVRQLDSLKTQTQKLQTVYNKKISDLEELKKSILQDAFSG